MISIEGLGFDYGNGRVLDGIDLDIEKGEFVLLTGNSGSGKSTLVRCLNGLVPHFYNGKMDGSLIVDGKRVNSPRIMSKTVGMLFQDPEAMFVSDTVESEVGFGHKKDTQKILKELGIWDLRNRNTQELSGGEKQRVALACVLVKEPKILILDEPLSELDHEAADRLMKFLKNLNNKGTTIILIEQRTERVYGYATRELVLEKGKISYDGKPKKNGKMPKCSLTGNGDTLVSLENVSFSYENNRVFEKLSEDFSEGELVILEGLNGSGKTTLLKLIMGLLKADSGIVNVGGLENPSVGQTAGAVGYVFQKPDNHLFAESVKEEVGFILKNTKKKGNIDKILKHLGILHYKDHYPRYLSGGEKQRVALASILVAEPKVLLLDEPTRGMDHKLKRELAEYLLHYTKKGNLVIMATHDEYMAACATRKIILGEAKT
jgi:energy-coupling factor transport system ATP-binding protein